MGNKRPHVPSALKRDILIEAGHRCAIPTCHEIPVDVAHIIPWKDCKEHASENLIALCANCHRRYDRGEIDRKSMRIYKQNLSIVSGRYGDLELRVLRSFADHPKETRIALRGGIDILLMYLIGDGLLVETDTRLGIVTGGIPAITEYAITKEGRKFVHRWFSGQRLR